MKNQYTLLLAVLAGILSFSFEAYGQDRNIFLIHGLTEHGTGKNAWIKYDEYFRQTRKARPFRMQYGQNSSITNAAAAIRQQMADSTSSSTFSQNIAIGHSQGGIVIRTIAKDYPGAQLPFGGLITVGSPNLGAPVINAYQAGEFQAFTQDATNQLLAGPSEIFADGLLKWIPDWANSKLSQFVQKKLEEKSAINNPTTLDFMVGAPLITQLQSHNAPIPKVGIISAETASLFHWRTLSSYTLQPVTSFPLNHANDEVLPACLDMAYGTYGAFAELFDIVGTFAILPSMQEKARDVAFGWRKGMFWIASSHYKYARLIGVLQITPTTYTFPACPFPCTSIDCATGNMGCSWQNQQNPIVINVASILPSDGIVPLSRQPLPGAIRNFELAVGVNHAQQRNHPEVTAVFNSLFNGETGVGALGYFVVPKKN